jgi:hypothetical protein
MVTRLAAGNISAEATTPAGKILGEAMRHVLGLMNRLGVVLTKNEPLKSVRRIAAEAASYGAQ